MYNSLSEFYERHERIEFLEYVVRYTELEAEHLGLGFEALVPFRGYLMLEDVYKKNIENLRNGGTEAVPLEILADEEIRHELRKKYGQAKPEVEK